MVAIQFVAHGGVMLVITVVHKKITVKISSHPSYISILLSFFTQVLVLLTSVKLVLFTYKICPDVIIYNCHIYNVPSHLTG